MKLSKTTQYAIRLLVVLSSNPNKLLAIKDIADELDIPYKYLTAIVTVLVKANFIKSSKGRNGGIKLSQKPHEINIIQILDALEEPCCDNECLLGTGVCNNRSECPLHESLEDAKQIIIEVFANKTLADLSRQLS